MNRYLKILICLLLIPVLLVALFYGGLAALFILSDSASYYGNQIYVGPIDIYSVITNAEKAGYDVRNEWTQLNKTSTIDPGKVESLEKRFKTDYSVNMIVLNYNESMYLEFHKYEGSGTYITIRNKHHNTSLDQEIMSEELKVKEDLDTQENGSLLRPPVSPEDRWILEMIGLVFGTNETYSQNLLERLKLQSQDYWYARLYTNESVNFPAVYTYLNQTSTKAVFNAVISNNEVFYRSGKKIGYISYALPETTITTVTTSNRFNKYTVTVRNPGYVNADISMHEGSAGEKIPEEEYRAVFKEIFEKLGLPPSKVDDLRFEYNPSVW